MGKNTKDHLLPGQNPRTSFRSMLEKLLEEDRELRWEFEEEGIKLRFAEEIEQAREQLGLTQQTLAERCKTTQSAISRFLNGLDTRSPRLDTLVKLADAVGKKISFRLDDRDVETEWIAPVLSLVSGSWKTAANELDADVGSADETGSPLSSAELMSVAY